MKNDKKVSRICQRCGKPFNGTKYSHYCSDCLKKIKSESTYKERVCIDCGRTFMGGPTSKRCPDCQREKNRERDILHKKYGAKRPIGSTDKCIICGKEYIVKSGTQKYCSTVCAKVGLEHYNSTYKSQKVRENIDIHKKREKELNNNQLCVCKYCGRPFKTSIKLRSYCSDYCSKKADKIQYAVHDEKRGISRKLQKLLDERTAYRNFFLENPPE